MPAIGPSRRSRLEMLREAVSIIRQLWSVGFQGCPGKYFVVENAYIYTSSLPPRHRGPELAGEIGDGLITTGPDAELVHSLLSGTASPATAN